jgi:1-acyl-sn-glycerol-3-phosphate acyltransferase
VDPYTALGAGLETDARETGDDFGLDPEFRHLVLPAFRFLHDRYWRVEVSGVRHLPRHGPALLVANHSGAIPFDGAMIVTTVELRARRTARFLYDRFVERLAPMATFYRKVGGTVAARDNASALLRAGELVLLFPEGVPGVAKPFEERYRLRAFSPGFVRLATALDVPIVPVAVVGAEEIYPLVGRLESVGRLFGMPYVPVTPFFPLLGPLGAVPLPTKWFIRFGRPIRLAAGDADARAQRGRIEAARVRRTIQAMVRRLKAQRQSVFFG